MRVPKLESVREIVSPRPWLKRPRAEEPTIIIIHATRGNTGASLQYQATKNWMKSYWNNGDNFSWGSSCDFIIGNEPGEIAQVGNLAQHSTWGAGYGTYGEGTWGADSKGISIEVAQSVNLEEYDTDAINNLVNLCEELCRFYGIVPRRIPYLAQTESNPNGFVGHEDTANGKRLGKTDPGPKFPWGPFLATLNKRLMNGQGGGGEAITPQEVATARLEFGNSVRNFWLNDPSRGRKWSDRELEAWREKYSHLFE